MELLQVKKLILKTLEKYPEDHKFSKDDVAELGAAILLGATEGSLKAMGKLSHKQARK